MKTVNIAALGDSLTRGVILNDENRYSLIQKVLYPYVGNLIVTPKEVDSIIEGVSRVISESINCSVVSKSGNNPQII